MFQITESGGCAKKSGLLFFLQPFKGGVFSSLVLVLKKSGGCKKLPFRGVKFKKCHYKASFYDREIIQE